MGTGFDRVLEHEFPGPEGRAELESRVRSIRAAAELTAVLEELREQRDVSKARLAALVKRHPPAVSRLLKSRKSNPTVDTLIEVIEALGVYLRVEVLSQPDEGADRHPPIEITLPERVNRAT